MARRTPCDQRLAVSILAVVIVPCLSCQPHRPTHTQTAGVLLLHLLVLLLLHLLVQLQLVLLLQWHQQLHP